MNSKKVTFKSMDEYVGTFPEDIQKILVELRATIKAAAPEAEETISYNIPTLLCGVEKSYFTLSDPCWQ
jgi:uncharacterized protein YdhG (YjbR/CyaY superfamily)